MDKYTKPNFCGLPTAAELREALIASEGSDVRVQLGMLFDEGTFVETSAFTKRGVSEFITTERASELEGVICGYGAIDGKLVFPCVALGMSTFIMQSSESVISVCFNASLLKYGGDIAVGAMTILTSVMQFAMLPMQGIAQGAQPISSYNFGARNTERVKKTFRLLLTTCLIYSLTIWAIIMAFPGIFAGIFTPDAELIEFTSKALRIYCAVLGIFGIQIACQMTFVSTGNAPCSIIVAIVRKFVLLLPLIYLMPQLIENKTIGVYSAEPVADVIAVTFTAILFTIQFRKSLKSLNTNPAKEISK